MTEPRPETARPQGEPATARPYTRDVPDSLTHRENATRLASRIKNFWQSRGLSWAKVWVEPFTFGSDPRKHYQVRSNIVMGNPITEANPKRRVEDN